MQGFYHKRIDAGSHVGTSELQNKQNEYPHEPKNTELYKPRFEVTLINRGEKSEPTNKRKRKRDQTCKEEKKLEGK